MAILYILTGKCSNIYFKNPILICYKTVIMYIISNTFQTYSFISYRIYILCSVHVFR